MSDNRKTRDVVLRLKQRVINIAGRPIDVIQEHNSVIEAENIVALAKFGKPLSADSIVHLQTQIDNGFLTYLYLVFREPAAPAAYTGYRAPITSISIANANTRPPTKHPQYYDALGLLASVWFVLSAPFKSTPLYGLKLISNRKRLLDVLPYSQASIIFVTSIVHWRR